MNSSTTISIILALVAALTSLIVAGVSYFSTRKNTHDIESVKANLAEKLAGKNARRDYEYEARKRLYQQYEPLFFQLIELSESALRRIEGLARSASQGNLMPDHTGWLAPNDYYYDYYMASTIYRLLAPLAVVKLMQRLLTLVDLTVDPHINNQYALAKWLYMSFTEDFALARIKPCLDYDPNHEKRLEKQRRKPEKYWRQGIFAGVLDNAVEALLVHDPNEFMRCMSFGEFESTYKTSQEHKFYAFIELFKNFHPKTRPVLWRVLITQAYLYKAMLHAREMRLTDTNNHHLPKLLRPMSEKEHQDFDWHQSSDKATEEDLTQPFDAAYVYLREHLGPQLIE